MRKLSLVVLIPLILSLIVGSTRQVDAAAAAQANDPASQARALMATMTPEEKVGQLFLVSFTGTDATMNSDIYNLIVNYHVGGVVLRADNDNFTGPTDTVSKAAELIRALQTIAWDASQRAGTSDTPPAYVPLFVGISQEGDSAPNDQILNGMTELPSEMSIGATWDPSQAESVGKVMGEELHDMGFNLFLGPSLDVLDVVNTTGDDLGVQTFGGDPYWVGVMGKAYIKGLHEGSQDQIAVIAKNFPGRGSSDRPPEEEVATVRKSLDALKQIELAPFFAAMADTSDPVTRLDGVLVSHIRYQGLQENIREITPPISLDADAMKLVLNLEPAAQWYQSGGVIVSDSLGSNAVRKFYDPTMKTFDARTIARNAFNAGNDLLYLNNFVDPTDADSYTTISHTLESFAQKYREDPAFAQRVDQSVLKLLTLKYRMYGNFRIDQVLPGTSLLNQVGTSQSAMFGVAQEAVTLINPDATDLDVVLPQPPEARDHIIFFTDVVSGTQCSTCQPQDVLAVDSLKNAIMRLYGPAAGGTVNEGYLSTYTFQDLDTYLNGPDGVPTLGINLNEAGWVVFALSSVNQNDPNSTALKRVLSDRADLLRNKKVIVFSFGAPYYLDATDISKVTAYYGLFSKTSPFVDMAARVLYQEITPNGASPVSIPGVGYDIIDITSPDPNQVIPLILNLPLVQQTPTATSLTATPEVTATPAFTIGDTIAFHTGVILDHNGHPVPDGTVVNFLITNVSEGGNPQQIDTVTTDGVASASYKITSVANLEITVVSEPATISQKITLNNGGALISTFIPTLEPTETPEPTATQLPSPTPTATLVVAEPFVPKVSDWFLATILVWVAAAAIFFVGQRMISLRWGVRWGLMAATGGMLAYIYLNIGWIIPINRFLDGGTKGVMVATLTGTLVGWLIGWLWQMRLKQKPAMGKRLNGSKSGLN